MPSPPAPNLPLPSPIQVPPPTKPAPYQPFPQLAPLPFDEANDGYGLAQKLTRERGLQARILWIDATANLDRVNAPDKIREIVKRAKESGFNTLVFEVKPIVGFTMYPSKFAPRLTEWVKPGSAKYLPASFDPLAAFVSECKGQQMGLIVNFNAFAEGHRDFQKGPGYDHPDWQTTLYEPQLKVRRDALGVPAWNLTDRPNLAPRSPDDISVYNDLTKIKGAPETVIALVDRSDTVLAQTTLGALPTLGVELPAGGAALVAYTQASQNFLRLHAQPGLRLTMDSTPVYVPISQRPERQVPLMTNPHNPVVRKRLLDMLTEVVTGYAVDGVIFDDRLRYASLNADFSDATRREFEQYVGKPVKWPDDVFRYEVNFPSLERAEVPGPLYDSWLTFRALNTRNFLADVVRTVKTARPGTLVSTYVGSWYPDYPDIGANWAATDTNAGFRFLNPSYKQTGWADLVDFVTTGCYYDIATIQEAAGQNVGIGETVEAAGQFSNRLVNDSTWVYAGLQLDKFKNRPDALRRCLQAAAASTQGIMVFDLSHDIDALWPVFAQVFAKPAQAPHFTPGALADLRAQKEKQRTSGTVPPPTIIYKGASGTGF